MGHTCGEPNEIEFSAAQVSFHRSFSGTGTPPTGTNAATQPGSGFDRTGGFSESVIHSGRDIGVAVAVAVAVDLVLLAGGYFKAGAAYTHDRQFDLEVTLVTPVTVTAPSPRTIARFACAARHATAVSTA